MTYNRLTTGIPGLDDTIKGLAAGDNVVWRITDIDDYLAFVRPFVAASRDAGTRVIYFRFANHPPLLDISSGVECHVLDPHEGFESFIANIHAVIQQVGVGASYVFDCLSGLATDWYSDQMLGNFFTLTCPYLYDLQTIAYFAIRRNHHSHRATDPIFSTTQLFLDIYRHADRHFVRPLKVQHRYAQTMDMLHVWEGEQFIPVTRSDLIAEILHAAQGHGEVDGGWIAGPWERAFIDAEEALNSVRRGDRQPEILQPIHQRLLRMVISRDEGMLRLASRHLTIEDLLGIRRRLIGTGLIGGKAVGMLVARAILRTRSPRMGAVLESHDSFYIGSDVFYTYLVRNGVWWVRQKQRNQSTFLEGADQARQNILTGSFPDHIMRQFDAMLDYFGQSPIIVRSSSLLEDNFGNSFAGKYDSVFCANQGPRERRRDDFLAAVRAIYTSSMSERALRYRAQRGLLEQDEQMALLVMRVSGSAHGGCFYPHLAGVGFSFNPYAWNEYIDPAAGVARLVFGLGTRAVDRSDDDYTRVVALNDPTRRPETNFDEVRQYAQRRVDFLDLEANQLISGSFIDVIRRSPDVPEPLFTSPDQDAQRLGQAPANVLTFDGVLTQTRLVEDLRESLRFLQEEYGVPVDIEFTANFLPEGDYHMNLVQCRPLPVRGQGIVPVTTAEEAGQVIIAARGAVIGHSRITAIDRFIYVVPQRYGQLPIPDRHAVAQLLGRINRAQHGGITMLLGPGRWGTSTPSLGIPVSFADIDHVSVLCEIVTMREDLIPDVSLGTHFLNELIEQDVLYLALFPGQGNNHLDEQFFLSSPNRLLELVPDAMPWTDTVCVVDVPSDDSSNGIILRADARGQQVVCRRRNPVIVS